MVWDDSLPFVPTLHLRQVLLPSSTTCTSCGCSNPNPLYYERCTMPYSTSRCVTVYGLLGFKRHRSSGQPS